MWLAGLPKPAAFEPGFEASWYLLERWERAMLLVMDMVTAEIGW